MRDMLEPIFGESGAIVALFVMILLAVLLVLALVYWIYQRFGFTHFGHVGRGRIPRLAIIDALSIDNRRKLVLIRRDHVEHLILIGGTSDLVVEPSIVRGVPVGARPRPGQSPRPQQSPAANAPGANAAPAQPQSQPPPGPAQPPQALQRRVEASGISEPIPFPQAKRPPSHPINDAPLAKAVENEMSAPQSVPQRRAAVRAAPVEEAAPITANKGPASAHFEEPARPTRIESVFSLADALDEIADEPAAATAEFAGPGARSAPLEDEAPTAFAEETDEGMVEVFGVDADTAPATATDDSTAESDERQQDGNERADRVGDLEREMARLLGEITSKRES